MKNNTFIISALILSALLTGCSTIYERTSLSGSAPKEPYPATRTDIAAIKFSCKIDSRFGGWNGERKPNVVERGLMLVFFTIDAPVSLITDTLWLYSDLHDDQEETEPKRIHSIADSARSE